MLIYIVFFFFLVKIYIVKKYNERELYGLGKVHRVSAPKKKKKVKMHFSSLYFGSIPILVPKLISLQISSLKNENRPYRKPTNGNILHV